MVQGWGEGGEKDPQSHACGLSTALLPPVLGDQFESMEGVIACWVTTFTSLTTASLSFPVPTIFQAELKHFTAQGFRVIGLAHKKLDLPQGVIFSDLER